MTKMIVGILTNLVYKDDNKPYENVYKINKLYVDKIIEVNAIPLGLIPVSNKIDIEVLDKCDAFIMQGGFKITQAHYQLIKYSIDHNKPLLGICLGMQAMVFYDFLVSECMKDNEINIDEQSLYKKYAEIRAKDITILQKIENFKTHGGEICDGSLEDTQENIEKYRHLIKIDKPSLLYDIYNKNEINVYSIHGFGVYQISKLFKIVARSDDSLVEAIQYISDDHFILGVQYHPEQDKDNKIFNKLVEEAFKRIQ